MEEDALEIVVPGQEDEIVDGLGRAAGSSAITIVPWR